MRFLASFGFVWLRFHVFFGLPKLSLDRAVIGVSPFFRMGSFRNFAGRTKNMHVTMFFRFVGVIMGILGISVVSVCSVVGPRVLRGFECLGP